MRFEPLRSRKRRGRARAELDCPDWSSLADGRLRRLERGVDFHGEVQAFAADATQRAAAMGKHALILGERTNPDRYLWLQFAAASILPGDPCPCGGRVLQRVNPSLFRCASCDRLLAVNRRARRRLSGRAARQAKRRTRAEPLLTLAGFSSIHLVCVEESNDMRRYVGFAADQEGTTVMMCVREPLAAGVPVPDDASPTGSVHEVTFTAPTSLPLAELALRDDRWDVVVP